MFLSMSRAIRRLMACLALASTGSSRRPAKLNACRLRLEELEDRCTPSTIEFAVIGDYGSGSSAEANVASLVKSWNPDFIITTGDNNYGSGSADTIDDHIGQFYHDYIGNYSGSYGAGSASNRFYPSLGNHDWGTPGAQPYLDYFTLPGNERYYNFTQGPVEFFVIDSDDKEPDGISSTSVQAQWLQSELADSTAVWKLVYFHHSPYSSGSHGPETDMQWPFQQWGASAVFSGHDHIYERLIVNNLPYFVNGLGGSSKYSIGSPLAGSQVRYNADYGAMFVTADESQLTFQFVTQTGTLIDSYTIYAANASPIVTSGAAPTAAAAGSVYSYQFTASGSPAPTLSASGLPGWLSFNASTGLLSGTPTSSAIGTSATITLTASNGLAPNATMTFTVNVVQAIPALVVSPASLTLGTTTAGTAGSSQAFTVSGSALAGNLVISAPSGVQLSTDGNTWSTILNLTRDPAGTVPTTTIQARIAAEAGVGTLNGAITVTSSGAQAKQVALTGTVVSGTATPISNSLYLLSPGTLTATPGTSASSDTIASANGKNYDGTPTNALVYEMQGLTGTYDPARLTRFTLFLDAGTQVANGTQLRVSYDFNGDGVYDRSETYRYFAEDDRVGWEAYTQARGLKSASGSFANFENGGVKVEVWNAIGKAPVLLRTDASATNGQQSVLQLPFTNLTQTTDTQVVPILTNLSLTSVQAGSPATTITLSGSNFLSSATALFNGTPLATTWISSTQLTAVIPAANLAAPATASITVSNPGPEGGISGALTFTITAATPALVVSPSSLALGTTTAGAAGSSQTFTVSGSALVGSLVISAPTGVQLSTDGNNYSTVLNLAPDASGTVTPTTIHARIAASASAGTITGVISVTSTNAAANQVAVTGTVVSVAKAIPLLLSNLTNQQVHFTMYGIDNSTGQWSYFLADPGSGNTFSGTLATTQQLGAGQDLPTYSFSGPAASLYLPQTPSGISSAAIIFTVGDVPPSITVASNFTLPRPAPSNPTLVNATTNPYYDYIEFTLDGNNTLNINTTQVDQFGFPITLTASPQPSAAPVGVTPGISRDAILQAYVSFLSQESDTAADDYLPLLQTANEGSPYRIIAPGQYLAIPAKSSDPLASYFDSAIQSFFTAPPPLTLSASGITFVGTATTHNPVASGDLINGVPHTNPADNRDFRVIDFVAQPGSGSLAGQHFYIYSPIDPPSWVLVQSAGEQVFANNGVFADNGARFSGQQSSILGNLENQVVSALTRGIANLPTPAHYANTTAFWTDPAQAFPDGQEANLYAKFLHTGEINGTEIFIGGRVYAFPYSDQGEQAAFFAVHDPTSVSITLGAWSGGSQAASPTITSGAAPTAAAVGSVYSYQFTASGSPAPTLSASGLPDWLSFNASTGLLTGTPTSSAAGTSATITLTASNGEPPDAVMTFTLHVAPLTVPTLEVSHTSLALGTTTAGAAGSVQTFMVSGSNLATNLVLSAPSGVELSADGNTYSTILSLTRDPAGTVPTTTIHARIAASAPVGSIGGAITVTSTGAAARLIAVTGNVASSGTVTPIGNTLYLLSPGTLSAESGSSAQNDTIASAGGTNHDGTPTNARIYEIQGLTGTYDPSQQTQFTLFLDAGSQVANGTQLRVSYDFNGDGVYDRVETYRYFAENDLPGWEAYTRARGLLSATGSFTNFQNGSVKLEIWNAIGTAPVSLRTDASSTDGLQSQIRIPFMDLSLT